ncbi:hypothetical protein [Pyxidicoccus caerfyrddinensis]|uniref:hypothetical protein n=1 Tax=Pyxidicoccus caerfyrddinensis TaxID=2709663 RepID=UPI0013DAADD6|nr:hypothetical protein [Pyxidicoccus caerfyrddinensis]
MRALCVSSLLLVAVAGCDLRSDEEKAKEKMRVEEVRENNKTSAGPDFRMETAGRYNTTFVRVVRLPHGDVAAHAAELKMQFSLFDCAIQTRIDDGYTHIAVRDIDTGEEVVKPVTEFRRREQCSEAELDALVPAAP